MSGYIPGTPEYNAAVQYYNDLHYTYPGLLAKHGFLYYTDSPAARALTDASSRPPSWRVTGIFRGNLTGKLYYGIPSDFEVEAGSMSYWAGPEQNGLPYGEDLTVIQEPGTQYNWLYDASADVSWIPLRDGQGLYFTPGPENNEEYGSAQWTIYPNPIAQDTTHSLSWSDFRAGIEFVAAAIGPALIGDIYFPPETGVVEVGQGLPLAPEAGAADFGTGFVDLTSPAIIEPPPTASVADLISTGAGDVPIEAPAPLPVVEAPAPLAEPLIAPVVETPAPPSGISDLISTGAGDVPISELPPLAEPPIAPVVETPFAEPPAPPSGISDLISTGAGDIPISDLPPLAEPPIVDVPISDLPPLAEPPLSEPLLEIPQATITPAVPAPSSGFPNLTSVLPAINSAVSTVSRLINHGGPVPPPLPRPAQPGAVDNTAPSAQTALNTGALIKVVVTAALVGIFS